MAVAVLVTTWVIKSMALKKSTLWMSAVFVVFFGLIGYLISRQAQPQPPAVGEEIKLLPASHIAVGASHDAYNSNPPTSGPHYDQPANWGVYQKELPDEQLVHNLEHGGIWISYNGVGANTKSQIEDLASPYTLSVIVTPRAKDDAKITLASWGRLMKLDSFNKDVILSFIAGNKNRSPEPLAR